MLSGMAIEDHFFETGPNGSFGNHRLPQRQCALIYSTVPHFGGIRDSKL